MKLPDDFWSVNDDEPGLGGVFLAWLVLNLCLVSLLGWMVVVGSR